MHRVGGWLGGAADLQRVMALDEWLRRFDGLRQEGTKRSSGQLPASTPSDSLQCFGVAGSPRDGGSCAGLHLQDSLMHLNVADHVQESRCRPMQDDDEVIDDMQVSSVFQ